METVGAVFRSFFLEKGLDAIPFQRGEATKKEEVHRTYPPFGRLPVSSAERCGRRRAVENLFRYSHQASRALHRSHCGLADGVKTAGAGSRPFRPISHIRPLFFPFDLQLSLHWSFLQS